MNDISKILEDELKKRRELNPHYSLRGFAKYLGTSPATLSQVISGKRSLGKKSTAKILDKLGLKPDLEIKLKKKRYKLTLDEQTFELISDWHYFAILNLSEVKGAKADPRWVASRLGITPEKANRAIALLKNLGVIEIYQDKSFKRIAPAIKTTDEVPSGAIRNFHQGLLKKAQLAIESVPINEREFRSITFAGNSQKMKKAKELIKQLKDLVEETMESGSKDQVFQFSIQLFPLTKGE